MGHDDEFLASAYRRIRQSASAVDPAPAATDATATATATTATTSTTLPRPSALAAARAALPRPADRDYLRPRGRDATLHHLLDTITPALNGQGRSSRYHGFVTGGSLPIAEAADNLVSAYDQNVQVHLPDQTIATEVEDAALSMVADLLALQGPDGGTRWGGRTFTTGATASNILGLACGREGVVAAKARLARGTPNDDDNLPSVGELGFLQACLRAGVDDIQVLASMGHSSLSKAASVVGLGRSSVREVSRSSQGEPWRLDLDAVEKELRDARSGVATIVAISAGEVNTGRFATHGLEDMQRLRSLADRYGAWIHVDGAFGIFTRILPDTAEYAQLREHAAGLELADSITVDGHKLLNVPYDNGIFFTRKTSILTSVCQNPNAAYLTGGSGGGDGIQSPLNVGLENSRRFRALPVYAALLSEGREGLAEMQIRMVQLARRIAAWVRQSEDYVLLPPAVSPGEQGEGELDTHMVVLFRARDDALNAELVARINASRQWYVSGTKWDGKPACRVAVASWRVDVEEDIKVIRDTLVAIAAAAASK